MVFVIKRCYRKFQFRTEEKGYEGVWKFKISDDAMQTIILDIRCYIYYVFYLLLWKVR